MPIMTLTELDGARDRARAEVHRRAARAGVKAAEPLGIASSIWGESVTELVADILDIFQLAPAQKAELEPEVLHSLSDLMKHYAPAAAQAGTLASIAATLRGSTLARRAATGAATRIGGRVVRRARFGAKAAAMIARRAWVLPVAMGGGTAALYELLGRRCINQCHAYLLARIEPPAVALDAP